MTRKFALLLLLIALLIVALLIVALRDNPARPVIGEPRQADNHGISIRFYVSAAGQLRPLWLRLQRVSEYDQSGRVPLFSVAGTGGR